MSRNITGGPVRKTNGGEFMGRSEIIPRLTRRGKVHRAKQIYGTLEIMVDEKSSPEFSESKFCSRLSCLLSFPSDAPAPSAFTEASIAAG